ncbi:hypothetical protein EDB85DRAFT_1899346 [Lactarius pseudohatsudake]|nr:hypothetical protein EDB85DRAFT_1899346 [Lactarius pseudohatsudake]
MNHSHSDLPSQPAGPPPNGNPQTLQDATPKELPVKSTTAARIARASGPAAATADARKNRSRHQGPAYPRHETRRRTNPPCEKRPLPPDLPRPLRRPTTSTLPPAHPRHLLHEKPPGSGSRKKQHPLQQIHPPQRPRQVHSRPPPPLSTTPTPPRSSRTSTWTSSPSGRAIKTDGLLAHPFDADALKSTTHEATRELIFTAVSEITKSLEVEVSAPMPGNAAESNGKPQPPNRLLHPPGKHRHYYYPTSLGLQQHENVYHLPHQRRPGGQKRGERKLHWGYSLTPCGSKDSTFDALATRWYPASTSTADSSAIPIDEVWIRLREYLVTREYHAHMQGYGITDASPYHCGVCHGADHPRGLCPFPDTPGWNWPLKTA